MTDGKKKLNMSLTNSDNSFSHCELNIQKAQYLQPENLTNMNST